MASTKIPLRQRRPLLEQPQSIQLDFLGWGKPILHSACDFLQQQYTRGNKWDMDRCLLVLPGSFAGRRLTQWMATRATEQGLVLRPPEMLTIGTLPEKLYAAKFPFASDLEQVLAWTKVLRSADRDMLKPLLFEVPDPAELRPWMDLASILSSLHRELASDLVDFDDVAGELKDSPEEVRWQILSKLQRSYLDELHTAGLWDIQSARRFAIDHNEVRTDREIIMIGAVDLNRAQRRFLAAVADSVRVLVGAPSSYAAGFNPDGTLTPEYWQDIEIPIDESQIHVRSSASDAANELATQLANLGDRYSVHDVTVGIPDPHIVPALQETIGRMGVSLRYGPGTPVAKTPPMRVVELLGDYLDDGSIDVFSSLIRTPAIHDWLVRCSDPSSDTDPQSSDPFANKLPADFLARIDAYQAETLIRSVNVPEWPQGKSQSIFLQVLAMVDDLVKPLRLGSVKLTEWAAPLRSVLKRVYESVEVDRNDVVGNIALRACGEINTALTQLGSLPSSLDSVANFQETLVWLQNQLAKVNVPPPQDESAIEMLGWLELGMDDTRVLMLTGMHDGIVPESVNGDAFLPNQLRSMLGLMDNARRYARDAYAMLTLLHTRERMELILNHMSLEGDSQTPSRLLLAVPSEFLARRVKLLLNPVESQDAELVSATWMPRAGQTNIPIPLPEPGKSVRDMAVTDFKKYDQCPYRFYLNRVEKVHAHEHERLELDGGGFGDLLHLCLESLITSPVAASTEAKEISEWLTNHLKEIARKKFGVSPTPALQIQLEQAVRRLEAFAEHQAVQASNGWRIKHIELKVEKTDGIVLDIDGKPMIIHGRIDRIDYNQRNGMYAVWDYKTGDSAGKPKEAHLNRSGNWTDWQLPLYGLLIKKLKIEDLSKVTFGYILLPKNPSETQFVIADFSPEQHASAIASAKEIARKVIDCQFWPPKYKGIPGYDDCNAITQYPVVRRWDEKKAAEEFEAERQRQLAASIHPVPELLLDSLSSQGLSDGKLRDSGKKKLGDKQTDAPSVSGDTLVRVDHLHENLRASRSLAVKQPPNKLRLEVHKAQGEPDKDWFSPQMILASAGTGKTYNLASRALRLLFADQELDSILATTFTRKAAGEILHRVLSWLADAVESDEGFERLTLVLKPLVITRDTVRYQLGRLCSHLHRFRVSTLDSFYSQLARSFALELKLPPGWTLADPFQIDQLQHEAISRMFDSMDRSALKSLVSQLSKGEATRSIRREIESVVTAGYDLFRKTTEEAWNQLVVPRGPTNEQTEKALLQFRNSQLEHKSYASSRDKAVAKFESREWGEFLGLTLVQNADDDTPKFSSKELLDETVDSLLVLAKKAATEELASRRAQNEAAYKLLANYHTQLQLVKTRRRVVSFDDIAERLSNWMQETISKHRGPEEGSNTTAANPKPSKVDEAEMAGISYRLDCPISHLLLDEFQDTSPMQWNIIKPFAEAIVQGTTKDKSFFCVGDSKQAIYGWRGGVSEVFESVGKQIDRVRQEKLVKSYRSSPVVINFVNDVFSQLAKHNTYYNDDEAVIASGDTQAVTEWMNRYFTSHETSRHSLPGYVEFRNANCDKNRDVDGDESSYGLLDEVADRIAELHHEAPHIEIGVLTRTNRDVGRIIGLLRERKVEASQEGGNPLVDSSAVLLLLSVMKVANHPSDSLAYFHVKHSPLFAMLPEDRSACPIQLSAFLREQLDAFGYGKTLGMLANLLANQCVERDQDRLKQFVQLGYRFDTLNNHRIHDFIDYVERQKVSVPGMSTVRVMTIHQSKGLEFDAVFLPTLDQTIISRPPSFVPMYEDRTKPPIGVVRYMNRQIQKHLDDSWRIAFSEYANQQLAEALCVFYVALTRARQAIYLYTSPSGSPKKRWGSVLHSIFATQGQNEQPGIIIRNFGTPDWYVELEAERRETASEEKVDERNVRVAPSISLNHVEGSVRRLPWLRPSQSVQASVVDLASQWADHDGAGAVIGKLVHRWFEEIRGWIEDYKPNKKRLKEIAGATLTLEEMSQVKLNEWIERFVQYCEMPSVLLALSADRYRPWHQPRMLHLEVTNERRLLQIIDGQMLRGVIDRCVLGFDGDRVVRAEILDFKTDRKPDSMELAAWTKERTEVHGAQLRYYRRVLCDQFGLHPNDIQLTLLLLSEDTIVNVP
jgi:ATP-dependent exoDNAse (exonuclease V) beta subunit